MSKKWKPSEKQLSAYDELLRRQNVTRKRLLRIRKITEQETSFGRGLPDLVIPMKVRRHRDLSRYTPRFNSYEEYRKTMAKLRDEFTNFELSYSKAHYYINYKNALLNMLSSVLNDNGIIYDSYMDEAGILKPAGKGGRLFTDEQISDLTAKNPSLKKFFDFFNKVAKMSTKLFSAMYFSGGVPVLKWVYLEMQGQYESGQLDQFYYESKNFWKEYRKGNRMFMSLERFIATRNDRNPTPTQKYISALWREGRRKK